ncbi:MAG TPA: helix-turn-helix domain-containing protein, partial [Thermoleophilia bacterium]|nr:helix-turn-helix domain-containing protein [Thermoleophilia bacterium]
MVAELLGRATAALARSLTTMSPRVQRRLLQAPAGEDVLVAAAMQPAVVEHVETPSPLLPALLRGAQAKRQLLEAEGGTLSAAEVARLLRLSRQAVDKQRRTGRLLALRAGPSWRYPAWQFIDGQSLPGLPEVLAALRAVSP